MQPARDRSVSARAGVGSRTIVLRAAGALMKTACRIPIQARRPPGEVEAGIRLSQRGARVLGGRGSNGRKWSDLVAGERKLARGTRGLAKATSLPARTLAIAIKQSPTPRRDRGYVPPIAIMGSCGTAPADGPRSMADGRRRTWSTLAWAPARPRGVCFWISAKGAGLADMAIAKRAGDLGDTLASRRAHSWYGAIFPGSGTGARLMLSMSFAIRPLPPANSRYRPQTLEPPPRPESALQFGAPGERPVAPGSIGKAARHG